MRIDFLASLFQGLLSSEDGSIRLHGLLHALSQLGCLEVPSVVPNLVQPLEAVRTGIWLQWLVWLSGLHCFRNPQSTGPSEDNNVQQGIGTKSVRPVNASTRSLASSHESWQDRIGVVLCCHDHLSVVVCRDATHVVMHSRDDWDWLLCDVYASKDSSGLTDTWQSLRQKLWRQVVKMQVDVVLLLADSSSLSDFHGHGSGDDISTGQVLCSWSITLHESLSLAVSENPSFASRALCDQAARAVDPSGVKLDKLQVLQGNACPGSHRPSVPGTGVCAGGREPSPAVSSRRQDGLVSLEPVDRSILHAQGHHTLALPILHDQVKREILHEELGVVLHRLAVERVKHSVPSPVGSARTPVGLAALPEVKALSSKGPLVDLPVFRAREGQSRILELDHGLGRLAAHVLNGVLVPKPIASFNSVVCVPAPVVFGHIRKRGVDSTLGRDGVTSCREELGDAGCVESL
mmetsp:Transcript_13059/g.24770  ORF Transcript_13059/g.24770 Transcript_13059/m.24770 type:complete len:462 (-) Transcript_13059:507-1892(-)